jgi:branched-chain amino acid transport system ATP-binding protein
VTGWRLETDAVDAGYGPTRVLHGVTVRVRTGEVVAVLGANGAGKTTLMRVLAGPLAPSAGAVLLDGQDITRTPTNRRVRAGVTLVPEGRALFPDLTVEENLLAGGLVRAPRRRLAPRLAEVFELFPLLAERRGQPSATLSGGQQQMLAVGRGLMTQPTVLLLDEPSLGLAPLAVRAVFDALRRLRDELRLTLLVVEQNPMFASEYADRSYVLEAGVSSEVEPAEGLAHDALRRAYLGTTV